MCIMLCKNCKYGILLELVDGKKEWYCYGRALAQPSKNFHNGLYCIKKYKKRPKEYTEEQLRKDFIRGVR